MSIPAPTNVRDYIRSRGWTLSQDAIHERLFVFSNPQHAPKQLVFPMDSSAPDYKDSVYSVAEKLAYWENVSMEKILTRFLEVRDDTLRLRISTPNGIDALPLSFAADAVVATQRMVLAGATSALRPQIHHARLGRLAEAAQLLNVAKFQHTEHSSFVIKVSCPYDGMDIPPIHEVPFVRQAMMTIMQGVRSLVNAIEADVLEDFVEQTIQQTRPLVSSNLCEAVTDLHDEYLRNELDISVDWSAVKPLPDLAAPVRIQRDYFPRIEEVSRALRDTSVSVEDTFVGTVEQLNGDLDAEGRRFGQVILNLFIEGEVVRAQVNLTAEQYVIADRVHMTDGAYVIVSGHLRTGRQPRRVDDISDFNYIFPREPNPPFPSDPQS
jgi:hypothetical protein